MSDAGKIGMPDLNAINWFRLYNKKSGNKKSRIDAIQIIDKTTTSNFLKDLNSTDESFNIYPNPLFGNWLSLDLNGFYFNENVDIKVTNLIGQILYQNRMNGNNQLIINISNWMRNSVYIVSLKAGEFFISKKLIVK